MEAIENVNYKLLFHDIYGQ